MATPRKYPWEPSKQDAFDGRVNPGKDAVRIRPASVANQGMSIVVRDRKIVYLENQKAVYLSASWLPPYPPNSPPVIASKVEIGNVRIGEITFSRVGDHIDAIKVEGAPSRDSATLPDLLIESVWIHDLIDATVTDPTNPGQGYAIPPILVNGFWNTITLRGVKVEPSTRNDPRGSKHAVTLAGALGGVVIDECPGLVVAVTGWPGDIKKVSVTSSPGISVANVSSMQKVGPAPTDWKAVAPTAEIAFDAASAPQPPAPPLPVPPPPQPVPGPDPRDAKIADLESQLRAANKAMEEDAKNLAVLGKRLDTLRAWAEAVKAAASEPLPD